MSCLYFGLLGKGQIQQVERFSKTLQVLLKSEMTDRSSQYLSCVSHALKLPGILCALESKTVVPETKNYFTTKGCMTLIFSMQASNQMQLLYVDLVNRYIFPPLGEWSWPVKEITFFSAAIRVACKKMSTLSTSGSTRKCRLFSYSFEETRCALLDLWANTFLVSMSSIWLML